MRNRKLTSPLLKFHFIDYTSSKLNSGSYSVTDFKKDLGQVLDHNPSLLNAQDDKGNSLLHYCFLHNHVEHLKELTSQAQKRRIPLKLIANKQGNTPLQLPSQASLFEHLIQHYQQYSDDDLALICEDDVIHCDICDAIYKLEKSFTHNSLAIANNALDYAISKNYKIALDLNEKISDEKLKKTRAVSKKFNSRIKARKKLQETPATTTEVTSAQQAIASQVIKESML